MGCIMPLVAKRLSMRPADVLPICFAAHLLCFVGSGMFPVNVYAVDKTTSPTKLEKCWIFSQSTDQFGDVVATIGSTGAKVDCMRGTCSIITRKPSWEVQIYNLQDKRSWTISQKTWTDKGVVLVGGTKRHFDNKECTREKQVFQKLAVTKYTVATNHYRNTGASEMFQTNQGGRRETLVSGVAYTSADRIACAPQSTLFLQCLYKSPRFGVPLKVVYIHPKGLEDPLLRTRSWKTAMLPAGTFDYIKGGSRAPSVESALFGRQMEGIMEEMVK